MPVQIYLIWHQFIKETREHRNALIGILLITIIYTALAASGLLESIQTSWHYPLLTQNPLLPYMFTLVPGLFIVPFLAFADSFREANAFWITKPLGATTVVGAKLLWISVWLIGFPLLGECLVVATLNGTANLGAVTLDFILIRATYFFTIFALASLYSEILHFTVAVISIPFVHTTLDATMASITPRIQQPAFSSPTAISTLVIWTWILPAIALAAACLQYRYRFSTKHGTFLTLGAITIISALPLGQIDLLDHPLPEDSATAEAADEIQINIHSSHVIPRALTPEGTSRDQLEIGLLIANQAPLTSLLLNKIQITLTTPERRLVIEQNSHQLSAYRELEFAPERIFQNIISQLKDEPPAKPPIPAKITVELPQGERASHWKDQRVTIQATASFDLFDHVEFGRMSPNLSGDLISAVTVRGTHMKMHWTPDASRSRLIAFTYRHIAANFSTDYQELRSRWNPMVIPWYFVFRDLTNNTYWERLESQNNEHCQGSSFCALHVARSTVKLPPGATPDEVIIYASRYVGTLTHELSGSDILLQQRD